MNNGVYIIRNTINNKCYIGSAALSLKGRWAFHKSELRHNRHDNGKLQNAWNKYGAESFVFEVLLYCDPQNCLMYEQIALDHYKPEYNIRKIATSNLGLKWSDDTREKMSRAQSGKKNARYGLRMSSDLKKKISKSRLGKCLGENNAAAKLTMEQVATIRASVLSGTQLALQYGVCYSTIRRILSGKNWKN